MATMLVDFTVLHITELTGLGQIRTRILSSQGADNTDSTLVTYVSNANFEARYIVDGTAGNPTIRFVSVNPL